MQFLKAPLKNFRALRPPVRALVLIYWIYAFAGGMVGVFAQLFLYQRFTSVTLNVSATMALYTGIMVGFCFIGVMAGAWRMDIKHSFLASFIVTAAAILYFLSVTTTSEAFLAMFLWGVGQGLFWLAVNTFELSETRDSERDLYSSLLKAGNQVLSLLGPASATLLIWLSGSFFHTGTYTLLFTVAPLVYLLGFFYFAKLRDYRPPRLVRADIAHYFTDRTNQAAQLYTLGSGFQDVLSTVVPSLVILLILGTALKVGLYDTFFAVFSTIVLLALAGYRTPENRLAFYGWTTAGVAAAAAWLGYAFSFVGLVVYTIVNGVLAPVMGVSSHVISLASMEIGRKETDFYATMILRDFFLFVWRIAGGMVFLGLMSVFSAEQAALASGLYLIAAAYLVKFGGAALFVRMSRQKLGHPMS
ncbi:MAG: hypothetical protein KGI73_01320 [Patescibacteria group bacterium]|nr:hypothetical protein [Patescibacteria group bacterium]